MATDAQTLLTEAKCYACFGSNEYALTLMKLALLQQISNAVGGFVCESLDGAGSPVGAATPDFIGQLYHDTEGDAYWRSTGLTSADWVVISGGSSQFIFGPATTRLPDLEIYADTHNTTYEFPTLERIDVIIYIQQCTTLLSVSFPQLTTIVGNCELNSNPALTTVSLPLWVPTNGTEINFFDDALSSGSVAHILARCVAAAVTTCVIDLSGGTNAGLASLSAQGQADYATLVAAGNTVIINP